MDTTDRILWLDVETTGTVAAECALLQVAGIVTDPRGNVVSDEFNEVVYHGNAEELRAGCIKVVQEMHDATGLWGRLKTGLAVDIVDGLLYDFVKEFTVEGSDVRLGGNSVKLDFEFTREYLPKTFGLLHYRVLDVSSLAYALYENDLVSGYFKKTKSHDALDDIRESLAEYRWLMGELRAE